MQGELERVLELQRLYDSRATPAMKERGLLVRDAIPDQLREHAADLGGSVEVDDFFVQGRDGTGLKTRVPWIRFGSRSRSPSATEGFYVVYLFDASGDAVYLSLNQGTTDFIGGEFVPKPSEVIIERANWARSASTPWRDSLAAPTASMKLHDPHLGAGYELGNVAAVRYEVGSIPSDEVLIADALSFAEGLGMVYSRHVQSPIPHERPELREAEEAAERAGGSPTNPSRAGFRTNSNEIKAIEAHAVALARAYYLAAGFTVKELGKPFDLEVKKGDLTLTVEVKGTTSDGSGVSLTAGEVAHHAAAFPENAHVVVRGISLERDPTNPSASGGRLFELRGWEIDPNALRPISFAYEIPPHMYEHEGVPSDALL